ncbi:hypothetical protein BDW22DRAFT_1331922 [Trametopsis cervina]|nr:hypothetical protein BDW22DRAFT_1331922 [Trametopsis cervina]
MEAKRRKLILKYRGEPLLPSPIAIPSSSRLAKSTHSASVVNARSLPETAPPISAKDWTFDNVLQQGERFKPVKRISALSPGLEIARAIEQHEASGEPLIIEGYQKAEKWSKDLFNVDWLIQNHGQKRCSVRNVTTCTDEDMTLEEYIGYTRTSHVEREQLLYYKDADCPSAWRTWVNEKEVIPPSLRPGGENDLMQHLTQQESVESLMCYLGVGDTFTPCHKDLCGSSGHNIMCYTENDGSSFWFLTASSDAPLVGVFFQEELHSELDWEQHAVTLEQFAKAPFTVYVAEQKLGDLVLIPPRSCHQVVNHGGLTIKTSWSRMTVRGLKMALQRELPIYRRVCRREQYRVKYIVYRSLLQYTKQLSDLVDDEYTHPLLSIPGVEEMARTLETVLQLFDSIIYEEFARNHDALPTIPSDSRQVSEIFQRRSPSKRKPKPSFAAITVESTSSNFACDFCGSDIFQSFFECQSCAIPPDETVDRDHDEDEEPASTLTGDGLIICPSCYVEGRTCACGIMHAAQCRPFSLLINRRNDAAAVLRKLEGDFDKWADLPTCVFIIPT